MIQFLYFFIPGAITYLIAEKFSRQPEKNVIHTVAEWMFCTAADVGVYYMYAEKYKEIVLVSINENGILNWNYEESSYTTLLFFACILGVVYSVIREVCIEIRIVPNTVQIFSRLSTLQKKIIRVSIFSLILLGGLGCLLQPVVKERMVERTKSTFEVTVQNTLDELQEAVLEKGKEQPWAEISDIQLKDVLAVRVKDDQNWRSQSPSGTPECVYMIDGTGKVVYISYRDKHCCVTFSGPSEDSEFLNHHASWNGGNGWGWSKVRYY